MRRLNLCVGTLSLAMATAVANAATVNVHFTATSNPEALNGASNPVGGGTTVSPLGYTGSTWNDLTGSYSTPVTYSSLLDSDGLSSAVTATVNTTYGGGNQFQESPWSGLMLLHQGYWSTPTTLTIGGLLTDGTQYDVYLPSDANGHGGTFDMGGPSKSASGAQNTSWDDNVNYVHFDNVTPDGGGNIVVNVSDYPLSGFQIAEVAGLAVPEPASLTIIGLGGLALLVRRRRVI